MKTKELVMSLVGAAECDTTENATAVLCAHAVNKIVRQSATIKALTEALDGLLTYDRVVRPAFRNRPVGSPDSIARIDQDTLIRLEDAARDALAQAREEG